MSMVYLSIGSNIDREASVRKCLAMLTDVFGALQRSKVYESASVGFEGPAFWNLVVAFNCEMTLEMLRSRLSEIEDTCGRERNAHDMSRTMDIDLLLYGDVVAESVPREEIERYAFVLRPLAELAPEVRHPVTGVSMGAMWAGFDVSHELLTLVHIELGRD